MENFNWPLINDNITQDDKDAMIDFLETPNVRFTQGPRVREFESNWSEWLGVEHSTFVNSGASANFVMAAIIKQTCGVGEVIVPPLSWVSDVAPLVQMGMTPVFVDVSPANLSISADKIIEAITPKTKAIILVHALGFNALSDELLKIVNDHSILLIEDCCEAHGATFNGQKVGSVGHMSNFSYYFGHHMTCVEGGMISTRDAGLHELIKMYRSHGMIREASVELKEQYHAKYPDVNPLFTFAVPGFNVRNTEMNAVIAINQLKRLDSNIKARQRNFNIWLDNLDASKFWTDYDRAGNSNFALPLILHDRNNSLLQQVYSTVYQNGVEYRRGTVGGGSQVRQPYLVEGDCEFKVIGNLDITNHIHDFGLYIGNHIALSEEMIVDLCKKLNKL